MPALKEKVLSEALSLSPMERAELVENVLSSFEFSSRKEIDAKWAVEAEARIEAYEEGSMTSSPAEEVFDRINNG